MREGQSLLNMLLRSELLGLDCGTSSTPPRHHSSHYHHHHSAHPQQQQGGASSSESRGEGESRACAGSGTNLFKFKVGGEPAPGKASSS